MSNSDLFNKFLERTKSNLHVVLAFSPIGDSRKTAKVPALVNNTTIDWFLWPKDALVAVAKKFLGLLKWLMKFALR